MYSRFLIVILAGILALPAAADIIFDCGGAGAITMVSGNYGARQMADFEGSDAVATGIIWFGGYGESMTIPERYWITPGILMDNTSPVEDSFYLSIIPDMWNYYPDLMEMFSHSSRLDIVGGITRTPTGYFDINGILIYRYSARIAPLELHAGTTYGLSIVNSCGEGWPLWGWSTGRTDASHLLSLYEGDLRSFVGPAAFYLTDDDPIVPEPATVSLLVLGLAGLVLRGGRRVRAA